MLPAMLWCDEELEFQSPSSETHCELANQTIPSGNAPAGELPILHSELHERQLESMLRLERRSHSGLTCWDIQPKFTSEHRFFLVQWMHSACYQCDVNLSGFSVAVALLDRLLGTIEVPLNMAQLVTIAVVSIAAKLDGPDTVDDLTRFQVRTDVWHTQFTSEQIGDMEMEVLIGLDWRTHCATSADFIDRLLTLAHVGRDKHGVLCDESLATSVRSKAQHIVLDALHDGSMVALKPSSVAAAAVLIGMRDYTTLEDQGRAFDRMSTHVDEIELQAILAKNCNNTIASTRNQSQPSDYASEDLLHQEQQGSQMGDPLALLDEIGNQGLSLPSTCTTNDDVLCENLYNSCCSNSPSSTAVLDSIYTTP